MFDEGLFRRDGHGDFTSVSRPGSPSPAYRVVAAARRALIRHIAIILPEGYDRFVLEDACWILGDHDARRRVSAGQASELVQLAEQLLKAEGGTFLTIVEREAATELIKEVQR